MIWNVFFLKICIPLYICVCMCMHMHMHSYVYVHVIICLCVYNIDVSIHILGVSIYITSFLSRYSDILHDTVQLIFADGQSLFPKPSCFIATYQTCYRTGKLAYYHRISHNTCTVHIICSVKVKTWIYHVWYLIYPDIWYIDTT